LGELPPLPKDRNGEDVADLGEQLTLDE